MVKRHTEYVICHGDNEFPVEGHLEPIDGSEIVKIDGNKAKVGWLVIDDDGASHGYYFDEYDQGEFLNFDNRTLKSREPIEPEELTTLIRKNKGRVFWISKYEHGMVRYYRSGDALEAPNRHEKRKIRGPGTAPADGRLIIPDQQWDVSRGVAIYVAPDDCPDPAAYCDSTMEEFSDWCNGTIYGVVTQNYTRADAESEWEPDGEGDACWGFIGTEHAENSLKGEMA